MVLVGILVGCTKQKEETKAQRLPVIEGFPAERAASLRARARELANVKPPQGMAPNFFIATTKRWNPGSTVTVAFRGGTRELQQAIAQVASTWTANGNIGLDFGYDPATGYRQWQTTDTTPSAQVRVAFDAAGYWSCVGQDSVDPACANPNQQSLNLQGFDQQLPNDWRSTVLHEFGHAFGFEHEHQNPVGGCEQEFRFDNDAGYQDTTDSLGQFVADNAGRRPGIYKVLGGPPNNWDKDKVNANLREIPNSTAFGASAFDNLSIMKYAFPPWMYVNGTNSSCFSTANFDLSPLDRQGLATLYPRGPANIMTKAKQQSSTVSALSKTEGLPGNVKSVLIERAKGLSSIK